MLGPEQMTRIGDVLSCFSEARYVYHPSSATIMDHETDPCFIYLITNLAKS